MDRSAMKGVKEVKKQGSDESLHIETGKTNLVTHQPLEVRFGSNKLDQTQKDLKNLYKEVQERPKIEIQTNTSERFRIRLLKGEKEVGAAFAYKDEYTLWKYAESRAIGFSEKTCQMLKKELSEEWREDIRTLAKAALTWARESIQGKPEIQIYTHAKANTETAMIWTELGLKPSQTVYKMRSDQIRQMAEESVSSRQNAIDGKPQIIMNGKKYTIENESNFEDVYKDVLELYKHDGEINRRFVPNPIELRKLFEEFFNDLKETDRAWLVLKNEEHERKGILLLNRKHETSKTFRLAAFYVKSDLRGQGIGKEFFKEAMYVANSTLKAETVSIDMTNGNRVQSLYEGYLGLPPHTYIFDQGPLSISDVS